MHIYEKTRNKADNAVSLTDEFDTEEKQLWYCGQQTNRNNILSKAVKHC